MSKQPCKLIPMPASREPASLLAVDRAVSEVRRGRFVAVAGAGGIAVLVQAAEAVTPEASSELRRISRADPVVAVTARRAAVLGLAETVGNIVTLAGVGGLSADVIRN